MTKRIRQTSKLIHQSFRMIRQHKKLFLLPLASTIIIVLLLSAILSPLTEHEQSLQLIEKGHLHHVGWFYVFLLIFIFITHQIVFYFNAALTHCTKQYFKGEKPSLAAGIKIANHHFVQFFLWNLYAATIGIFLNLFQTKLQKYTFYQNLFHGLRWRIATYFAIPVILSDKTRPVNTIKKSRDLMQKTWGTHLRANFGFLSILVLSRIIAIFPIAIALTAGGKTNLIIGSVITVSILLIASLISSATRTILCSALHLYASEGVIAKGFDETLVRNAFSEIKTHT